MIDIGATIRDVNIEDRKQINEITKIISGEGHYSLSPYKTDEDIKVYSSEEDYEFLVALIDGVIQGYIELCSYQADTVIMQIFVHPDFRGKGVGDRLIKALILKVQEKKKHSEVYLQVTENNTAINLYERNKFVKTREVDGGYEMVHSIKVSA